MFYQTKQQKFDKKNYRLKKYMQIIAKVYVGFHIRRCNMLKNKETKDQAK